MSARSSGGVTRRQMFKRLAVAVSAPSVLALLGACTPSAPAAPTAAPAKPAESKPAATAAPAKPAETKPATQPTAVAKAPAVESKPAAAVVSAPIRVGMVGEGRTLDPHDWTNVNEPHYARQLYDNLVDIDSSGAIKPGLAKSWTTAPDGLSWTFQLQSGVKFHDGTDFNAEAVKFNLERMIDPGTKLRQAPPIASVVSSVDVIDPLTVRVNLKTPFMPLLASLLESAGYMVSPTAVRQRGDDFAANPVGAGPFQFGEWKRDSLLTLRRFEGYWRQGLPRAAGVVFQPIPDTAVKLTNLKTGDIDIVDQIDPKDVDAIGKDPSLSLFSLKGTQWPMVRLNTSKPPFNNRAARQAVAYGINRDAIIKAIYFGRAQPAFGPISPLFQQYYDAGIEKSGYAYDPAKAKQKLAEAGMADGFSFTMEISALPERQRLAELIQNDLSAIGIRMEVRSMESAAFTARLASKGFEGALGIWFIRPDPDGVFYQHYHSKGQTNWDSYSNPALDALIDKTRSTPVGPERVSLFRQAEQLIVNEVPNVLLVFTESNRASRAPVQGYTITPDVYMWLRETTVSDRQA